MEVELETTQVTQNEIAVIGSLLIAPDVLSVIESAGISPVDFQDDRCKAVYAAALNCRNSGIPIDPVVIGDSVRAAIGEDVTEWLGQAMITTPTANNVALYCQLVKQESQRRRLQDLLEGASINLLAGDWSGEIERIVNEINDIRAERSTDVTNGEEWANGFLDYYERTKSNPANAYCKTGFDELDAQLGGGMFRSEVYVIGARPGMGKTTLGINIGENVASSGRAVLFVSLEMTSTQIMAKRIALEGGLQYTQVMSGRLDGTDEEIMRSTIERIAPRPFYLTTKSGLTVGDINSIARQIQSLSLVIVDYMGLIPAAEESRSKPRYEQMTEISAGIKALAKSLDVPVLALAQLNRENMSRKDKRPTMSDLRDSGAVEQDAGAIILLHRPEYYETHEPGEMPEQEDIELNVAKNRHASPGCVHMTWDGGKGSIKSKAERPVSKQYVESVDSAEALPF